jgi:hypothetical protein
VQEITSDYVVTTILCDYPLPVLCFKKKQNLLVFGRAAVEGHIHNSGGTIEQVIQIIGNTSNVFLADPNIKSESPQIVESAELKQRLQNMYKQNYAKLPRLFSEETSAIADAFVNVAILKEDVMKEKESKLDTVQEKEDKQRDTRQPLTKS